MKNLEDELGVPLFSRTKNTIALTETGTLAVRHAQIVVSAHNDMIRTVREEERRRHSFSFGSIAPAPMWELTPIASNLFAGKTASADLKETKADLIRELDDGTYNMIILLRPIEEKNPDGTPRYICKPFIKEELSALREIVYASELPSFITNITNTYDCVPQDKVAVPLLDSEVNVQFWCVCLAENAREYQALFKAIEGHL